MKKLIKNIMAVICALTMLMTVITPISAYAATKPAATSITYIAPSTKSAKITWTKKSKITGYQLQISTKSNFKTKTTYKIKKAKNTTKTVKKLKANKKYYVRIRTYKTTKGKNKYSAWSTKVWFKTKKASTNNGDTSGTIDSVPETETETDTGNSDNKPVDPATCTHKWTVFIDVKPTYNTSGYYNARCSKCGTEKNETQPQLEYDLDKSHYQTAPTCPGCETNNYMKLQYVSNKEIALTYQKIEGYGEDSICNICDDGVLFGPDFLKNRYYNTNMYNGFVTFVGEATAELPSNKMFKNGYDFHAYKHLCMDFNDGNPIYLAEGQTWTEWYKENKGINWDWLRMGDWRSYKSKGILPDGRNYRKMVFTDPITGCNIYNTNDKQSTPDLCCVYYGYIWHCSSCGYNTPAHHTDGTLAGATNNYYRYTITWKRPYEYDDRVCTMIKTKTDCTNTETTAYNNQYNVVTSRLHTVNTNTNNPETYYMK